MIQTLIQENGEFNPLYLENLVQKAKVSRKRKKKFTPNLKRHSATHWANHAGLYRDEELRKGPKFYHSRKIPRTHIPIKTHGDLVRAIRAIHEGESNHDHYGNVSGLMRERLRLAQSLRDRGLAYDASKIARMNYQEIAGMKRK